MHAKNSGLEQSVFSNELRLAKIVVHTPEGFTVAERAQNKSQRIQQSSFMSRHPTICVENTRSWKASPQLRDNIL